jgi:hypothetical protein
MEYWSEVAACSVRLHQCKEDRPPVFALRGESLPILMYRQTG